MLGTAGMNGRAEVAGVFRWRVRNVSVWGFLLYIWLYCYMCIFTGCLVFSFH
jgi:hypothetical protein